MTTEKLDEAVAAVWKEQRRHDTEMKRLLQVVNMEKARLAAHLSIHGGG